MRTLHNFAHVCLFAAALAVLATACSSDPESPGGSAGSPGTGGSSSTAGASSNAGSSPTAADPVKGAAVWSNPKIGCGTCHGENAAGSLGPNITLSKTAGIGNWTLAQFTAAVRSGKDTDGSDLCESMSRFPATMISDAAMADLFAYIGTKPISDTVAQGNLICP